MDKYLNIEGSERVVSLYGEWPSFHDAEVLSVNLDRGKDKGQFGPTVTVEVHGFTLTDELNDTGQYKTINHAQITFQFYDAVEFSIEDGFGTQNPLSGISIEDIRSWQLEGSKYAVRFGAHFSCDIEFKCSSICVLSVEEGMPNDSIYT